MRERTTRKKTVGTIRRKGRWLGGLATGGFALVALMALLLPASAALVPMTVVHTIRISAPYNGATGSPSSSSYTSGCGTSTIVTPAFFHWRTGQLGFSGTGATHLCSGGVSGYASTYESVWTSVPIVVLSGTNHITAKWTLKADGGQALHVGTCSMPGPNSNNFSECFGYAASYLSAYSYIYDATNGSYIVPSGSNGSWAGLSSAESYYQYCYGGNCTTSSSGTPGTFAFSGPMLLHFNAHGLVASHSYVLETTFYGSQYVSVGTYLATLSHGYGQAWLNFGTFGNGATLDSVTVR